MPLSLPLVHSPDGVMAIRSASSTLLVMDTRHPGQFVSQPNRAWLGPLTRLRGSSLDRQLATGRRPESRRLLATRALWLVSPPARLALARHWEAVLERVHRPSTSRSPHVPLRRDQILAAESDIRELLHTLEAPLPTPVRGVAMASWLLTDGAGPLYNPRSSTDLHAALREAITHLDPWTPLATANDEDDPTRRQ